MRYAWPRRSSNDGAGGERKSKAGERGPKFLAADLVDTLCSGAALVFPRWSLGSVFVVPRCKPFDSLILRVAKTPPSEAKLVATLFPLFHLFHVLFHLLPNQCNTRGSPSRLLALTELGPAGRDAASP